MTAVTRGRTALAVLLAIPIVAAVAVALLGAAPRSPVAYCRVADPFFTDLQYSGNVHRSNGDSTAEAQVLIAESDDAGRRSPDALKAEWERIHTAAVRLKASGLAAAPDQPQEQIDTALRRVYADVRHRCASVPERNSTPLDPAGLIGQPRADAYCARALTLFTDLVNHQRDTDQYARDRLVVEAESAANVAPTGLAADWTSALNALRQLQKTGSTTDDGTVGRLANDYGDRCSTPIPAPSSG